MENNLCVLGGEMVATVETGASQVDVGILKQRDKRGGKLSGIVYVEGRTSKTCLLDIQEKEESCPGWYGSVDRAPA